MWYMVIGQGEDGDYADNGQMIKALFSSEDGEHFTFREGNYGNFAGSRLGGSYDEEDLEITLHFLCVSCGDIVI